MCGTICTATISMGTKRGKLGIGQISRCFLFSVGASERGGRHAFSCGPYIAFCIFERRMHNLCQTKILYSLKKNTDFGVFDCSPTMLSKTRFVLLGKRDAAEGGIECV